MTGNRRPGLRSEAVRTTNLSTILRELHRSGPASRSALVERTGLTRTAVAALVADLEQRRLVFEQAPEPDGSPGRPSPIVTPDSARNAVLALDMMVDSIGVMAVGLGGTVLRSVRRENASRSVEQTIGDSIELIESVRKSLEPSCRLFGLGVAVPGLVRKDDKSVVLAPNLGWVEVDVISRLETLFEPEFPIEIANEANLGALAESLRGAVAGTRNLLYLTGEVGFGGGIIADGRLLTGRNGFAGEVGHIPVRRDGRTCRCGAVGCLETEIGEEALLERAGFPAGGGREALTKLINAAAEGDEVVLEGIAAHGRWLAFGIAGMVNVLNPGAVVLGGLLAMLFPYMEDILTAELDRLILPVVPGIRGTTRVLRSTLGADAPAIGAAELMWDTALDYHTTSAMARNSD